MANGWGSRERARLALKRMNQAAKQDDSPMAISNLAQSDDDNVDPRPHATSSGSPQIGSSKRSIIRLICQYKSITACFFFFFFFSFSFC